MFKGDKPVVIDFLDDLVERCMCLIPKIEKEVVSKAFFELSLFFMDYGEWNISIPIYRVFYKI